MSPGSSFVSYFVIFAIKSWKIMMLIWISQDFQEQQLLLGDFKQSIQVRTNFTLDFFEQHLKSLL